MCSNILKKGLVVSCQALEDEPLHSSYIMSKMAKAAVEGGAIAIRANSVNDIIAIKKEVNVPVIGLKKRVEKDSDVYITPNILDVEELIESGCEVIAIDATNRRRPNDELLEDIVKHTRNKYPHIELMADISTVEEAIKAEELGFDYISTTLCGYTEYTKHIKIPSKKLIKSVLKEVKIPVIAEGGIWTVRDLKWIVKAGVYGAVVGTAITRPQVITKRFNKVFLEKGE